MPTKKNNHYVPKFVLRRFSPDRRSVRTMLLSKGTVVPAASIDNQCSRDYFYGKDGLLEDRFERQESRVSSILFPVDRERLDGLTDAQAARVLEFVFYQRQRTAAAAKAMHDHQQAIVDYLAANGAQISDEDLASFRKEQEVPQLHAIELADDTAEIVHDLKVAFLLPPAAKPKRPFPAGAGFIIGDHPVAGYNQWAESHPLFTKYTGHKGIGCIGLQWFFPVDPGLCVCVYDPGTYEYAAKTSRVTTASVRDVLLLNSLQALHAEATLYFKATSTTDAEVVEAASVRATHPHLRKPIIQEGPQRLRPDGQIGQILKFTSPDARLAARFSFVRVTNKNRYRGYDFAIIPERPLAKLARELPQDVSQRGVRT